MCSWGLGRILPIFPGRLDTISHGVSGGLLEKKNATVLEVGTAERRMPFSNSLLCYGMTETTFERTRVCSPGLFSLLEMVLLCSPHLNLIYSCLSVLSTGVIHRPLPPNLDTFRSTLESSLSILQKILGGGRSWKLQIFIFFYFTPHCTSYTLTAIHSCACMCIQMCMCALVHLHWPIEVHSSWASIYLNLPVSFKTWHFL